MKGFLGFFIRWVVPAVGLIAVSLIIWLVGPLLAVLVPEGRRWALVFLLVGAWIAYRMFHIVRSHRRAAQVIASLAAETALAGGRS